MLVDKIWFLMSEMNRGPGYHTVGTKSIQTPLNVSLCYIVAIC